jgi:hypothetical protein
MSTIAFLAAVLAVWRVTHLVVVEDGPFDLLRRLREAAARHGLERLVNCFLCCSVWMAIPFALLIAREWKEIVVVLPALSGGAILLERVTRERDAAAAWIETKEE